VASQPCPVVAKALECRGVALRLRGLLRGGGCTENDCREQDEKLELRHVSSPLVEGQLPGQSSTPSTRIARVELMTSHYRRMLAAGAALCAFALPARHAQAQLPIPTVGIVCGISHFDLSGTGTGAIGALRVDLPLLFVLAAGR